MRRGGRGGKPVSNPWRDSLFLSVSIDARVIQLGLKAWFENSLVVQPWIRLSATLCLCFLICKMGVILMLIPNSHGF